MSPGEIRQRLWNIVIVLLVVVIIIAAAYLLVTNYANNPTIYSVEDIINNPDGHIGKIITVKGYYEEDTITSSIIPSGQQSNPVPKGLPVDISAVNLSAVGGFLNSNLQYLFTGILKSDQSSYGNPLLLVAENIVPN
jgi:hypothetical protein